MKRIGVVTTSRADYSICRPILREIKKRDELELILYVGNAHFSIRSGESARAIESDGFSVAHTISSSPDGDGPEAVASAMGAAVTSMARALRESQPEIMVVVGDRYEMFAAAAAAVPFCVPIAHVHGGEVTAGAIDDVFRNALTKMSHLHFPATMSSAERIRLMGEEPWRITVSGAPALDNLKSAKLLADAEIKSRWGIDPSLPTLLVTYHPETLRYAEAERDTSALLAALASRKEAVVFTAPNEDTHGDRVLRKIEEFCAGHPRARYVAHFGVEAYYTMMSRAAAMVGNSSSGIIEAASFGLPVVNVGDRQAGRERGVNVIDVPPSAAEIAAAIDRGTSPSFREQVAGMTNPYGDGRAAHRIVERLVRENSDARLLRKSDSLK